jgi:hypothetical protein
MARVKIPAKQKVILCLIFAPFLVGGLFLFFESRPDVERSAHEALTAAVVSNLAFIARGDRKFPNRLSDLPLRFPDGGDSSLLQRFDYSSFGTGCILRVQSPSRQREKVWEF